MGSTGAYRFLYSQKNWYSEEMKGADEGEGGRILWAEMILLGSIGRCLVALPSLGQKCFARIQHDMNLSVQWDGSSDDVRCLQCPPVVIGEQR